jgi:hypothetical protein
MILSVLSGGLGCSCVLSVLSCCEGSLITIGSTVKIVSSYLISKGALSGDIYA